jgi:hypothetical protein
MLASGMDQAFGWLFPLPGEGDGVLVERCRADGSCLAALRSRLGEVSVAADAMGIGLRLDAIAATVARWRPCAHLGQVSDAAWRAAVTTVRAYVRDRRTAVATYLGATQPAPHPALESTVPTPLGTGCPADPPRVEEPAEPAATPAPTPEPPRVPQPAPSAAAAAAQVAGATAARARPVGLTVHTRRRARRIATWGTLRLPPGVSPARSCGGRVAVRIKAGRRTLSLRRAALRFDCTYASAVTLGKAQRRKLTVHVRFEGTSRLLPCSAAGPATSPRASRRPAAPRGTPYRR